MGTTDYDIGYEEAEKKGKMGKARFIIDLILWIILVTAVILAYTDGHFIHKEIHIIEICQGQPINQNIQIPEELQKQISNQPEEIHWKIGASDLK